MMDLKREFYSPPAISDFPDKDKSSRKDAAPSFSAEELFLLKDKEKTYRRIDSLVVQERSFFFDILLSAR